jgi:hypothetical protein
VVWPCRCGLGLEGDGRASETPLVLFLPAYPLKPVVLLLVTSEFGVDLARARFKLPDAKTPKGVREVEMTLWNRGELVRHREQRLPDGFPMEPADHFFGTANGRRSEAESDGEFRPINGTMADFERSGDDDE